MKKFQHMKRTMIIIITLIVGVCIVTTIAWLGKNHITRQIQKQEAQQTLLIRMMDTIDLGDTYGDVLEKYYQVGANGLSIHCSNPEFWTITAGPFGFFAESDWKLLLGFEEKRVISVKMRSVDGLSFKPKGSPEDKVRRPISD